MKPSNWPPLRLETEKVILMRKAGTSTIVLAALLATGCVNAPRLAHGQQQPIKMPAVSAQSVEFKCEATQLPQLTQLLDYAVPYCYAEVDLDRNPKTMELITVSPTTGGSGGVPLGIFQADGANWARLDNGDQFAFFDRVATRPGQTGWSDVITNYNNGSRENVLTYIKGKYSHPGG